MSKKLQKSTERRVGVVIHSLAGGGAEKVALLLVRELQNMSIRPVLVCVHSGGELESWAKGQNIPLVYVNRKRGRSSIALSTAYRAARLLRRERFDALILNSFPSTELILFLKAVRILASRIVVVHHSSFEWHLRDMTNSRLAQVIYRFIFRRLIRAADHVVSPSQGASRELDDALHLTAGLKSQTIYNPFSLFDEPQADGDVNEVTDALKRPLILSVGRLVRPKNYSDLIHAFSLIPPEVRGTLVILGEGEERSKLEGLVRDLGLSAEVRFPGFILHVRAWLHRADVLAWSSLYEGLPLAMLEGAAIGKNIVSYDCPHGPREIAQFFPNQITLVPVGDVAELALRLGDCRPSNLTTDSASASRQVPKEFSLKTFAQSYLSLALSE